MLRYVVIFLTFMIKINLNTSLVSLGALTHLLKHCAACNTTPPVTLHCLQHCTACNTQNGRQCLERCPTIGFGRSHKLLLNWFFDPSKKNTDENSGHYVVASSRPPERRPLERRTLAPITAVSDLKILD